MVSGGGHMGVLPDGGIEPAESQASQGGGRGESVMRDALFIGTAPEKPRPRTVR